MFRDSLWNLTKEERRSIPAMVYVDLVESIEHYRELLQRAKRRGRLDHVAWITRNLLELRIWAEYCGKSTENAYNFYCDAVRDLVDMLRKFEDPEPEVKAELDSAKAFIGDLRPHHRFKPVSQAAEELGIKDFYDKNCKILSKYVHPTAMSVIARFRGKGEDRARKEFFDLGREISEDALTLLKESPTGKLYRKYRSTLNKVNAEMPKDQRPFPKYV
jgi:acyl-CoA-binding protein